MSGGLRPFHAGFFSPANLTSAGPCCSPVLPCSRHGWPTLVKQGCPEVALTPGCGATFVVAQSGLMLLGSTCCLNSFSSRKMKVRTCSCVSWTGRLRCGNRRPMRPDKLCCSSRRQRQVFMLDHAVACVLQVVRLDGQSRHLPLGARPCLARGGCRTIQATAREQTTALHGPCWLTQPWKNWRLPYMYVNRKSKCFASGVGRVGTCVPSPCC